MDIPLFAEFLLIGFLTGVLSGLFGVGGGFILVPLLVFADIPIHLAVGTSLGYVTCTSLAGAYKHFQQRNIHFKTATFLIAVSSLSLVTVGIRINASLEPDRLKFAFAVLLTATAIYFFMRRERALTSAATSHAVYCVQCHWVIQLCIGAVIGLLSGIFGVGGGFLLVPVLVLILNMPIKLAVGTSLFVIIFASFVGTVTHALGGTIDVAILAPLVVGGIAGAFLGAHLVHLASPKHLQNAFIALLFVAALYMMHAAFA